MGSQNMKNVEVALISSPRRSSSLNDAVYYYSASSSPKGGIDQDHDHASFDFKVDSNLKDFEFETSCKFHLDGFEAEKGEDFEYSMYHLDHCNEMVLPPMAFADELFSNGQVAPLKLPPRLHSDNKENKNGYLSSTASSPKSPSSVLRLSFSRKSLWNDEFDPFKTAMKNIRDEKRGRGDQDNTYRRARSQSPLRSQEQHPTQENGLSPYKLSKPKGLGIANQLRPLQAVCHKNTIDQKTSIVVCKTQGTRKNGSKQANCYGEIRVASEMKSIVQHRPKLFLCLGFGSKPSRE